MNIIVQQESNSVFVQSHNVGTPFSEGGEVEEIQLRVRCWKEERMGVMVVMACGTIHAFDSGPRMSLDRNWVWIKCE